MVEQNSEISAILVELRSAPDCKTYTGARPQDIEEIEQQLEVKLPEDYKLFLSNCGFAQIRAEVVFGCGPDAKPDTNVIDRTFDEQQVSQPLMPSNLVAIMNDGSGSHYCIDCSSDGEIVFWDHEHALGPRQRPKKIAKNFAIWLNKLLADTLD